ncbi:hypothetical protein [Nocardia crassostreae]|uniref:hypothetical protein n=1 Tax=Nocardia crassostreae TaxID=53428 RepID=UPI000A9627D0|nr:hypothetical protein [Nocardia crassostreae]
MTGSSRPLMILVAGPYRSGTGDDPHKLEANVRAMNRAALTLFRAGHLPVTGEALALPLLDTAGSTHPGDPLFEEIFHPIAERLLTRCDAVLRIGGPSAGADQMVAQARAAGKTVFTDIAEIPVAVVRDADATPELAADLASQAITAIPHQQLGPSASTPPAQRQESHSRSRRSFTDRRDTAVFTTRAITLGADWIACVFHDADDSDWYFHGSDLGPVTADDAAMVDLESNIDRDPSLEALADLPLGWCAHRTSPTAPWHRAPQSENGRAPRTSDS